MTHLLEPVSMQDWLPPESQLRTGREHKYDIAALFDNDEALLAGARDAICKAHLDAVKRAYKVDDWVKFLKRPDRLHYALLQAKELTELGGDILSGSNLTWADITSQMWGIGSDLWTNPTEIELRVSSQITELDFMWIEMHCWEVDDNNIDIRKRILQLYEYLTNEVK